MISQQIITSSVVIGGKSHPSLTDHIGQKLGAKTILAHSKTFEDQEWKVQIEPSIRLSGQHVILIQSTGQPANHHLMELFLLAETAKRSGCTHLTAVVPYLGYSRQDRMTQPQSPISASLVARLLEASGIDELITLDLHSPQSQGFFRIPVKNLSPISLWTNIIRSFSISDFRPKVVSPDVGGLIRAQALAQELGCSFAVLNKSRQTSNHHNLTVTHLIGDVQDQDCLIYDDIIDSGLTLCSCAEILSQMGARSIRAFITHGVFSKGSLERVQHSSLSEVYICDTISKTQIWPEKIKLVETANIFVQELKT